MIHIFPLSHKSIILQAGDMIVHAMHYYKSTSHIVMSGLNYCFVYVTLSQLPSTGLASRLLACTLGILCNNCSSPLSSGATSILVMK